MLLLCFAAPKIMCLKMIVQQEVESEGVVESFELRGLLLSMSHQKQNKNSDHNPCTRFLIEKANVWYSGVQFCTHGKVFEMCLSVFVPAGIWQQTNKKTKKQTNKHQKTSTCALHVLQESLQVV